MQKTLHGLVAEDYGLSGKLRPNRHGNVKQVALGPLGIVNAASHGPPGVHFTAEICVQRVEIAANQLSGQLLRSTQRWTSGSGIVIARPDQLRVAELENRNSNSW